MLSGACLCGTVRYEIDGRPRFMYRCYCDKCRGSVRRALRQQRHRRHRQVPDQRRSPGPGRVRIEPRQAPLFLLAVRLADLADGQPQFADWPDASFVRELYKNIV